MPLQRLCDSVTLISTFVLYYYYCICALTFADVLLLQPLKCAGATQPLDARPVFDRTRAVGRHDCSKAATSVERETLYVPTVHEEEDKKEGG